MKIQDILNKFEQKDDNLMNILHAVQNNNPENYLSKEDLKEVAKYLNLTMSHVYGVAAYYSMFSLKPRGKFIIRICKSPVCNMEGSLEVIDKLKKILSISVGETTPDKKFTLELSECLGLCGRAPSLMINEDVIVSLDQIDLKSVLEKYKF